jgi:hypothetical protein
MGQEGQLDEYSTFYGIRFSRCEESVVSSRISSMGVQMVGWERVMSALPIPARERSGSIWDWLVVLHSMWCWVAEVLCTRSCSLSR